MKSMYKLVIFFFFFLSLQAFAQKSCGCPEMDAFKKTRDFDSVAVHKNVDLWKVAKVFLKNKNTRCQAFGHQLLAQAQLKIYKLEDAKSNLDREKSLLDSVGCAKNDYLDWYLLLGEYHQKIGEKKEASDYFGRSIYLASKSSNPVSQSHALLSLSQIHFSNNNKEEGKKLLFQAQSIVVKLGDNERKIDQLILLGSRFLSLYRLENQPIYVDSASNALKFAVLLSKRIKYADGLINAYSYLEDCAYVGKNYRKAILYLDSALTYTNSTQHFDERALIFSDLADLYLEQKKYDKAYQFADSNLVYAKNSGNIYDYKNALQLVYTCSKLDGDFERALLIYEDIASVNDSIQKLKTEKKFNRLEERFHQIQADKSKEELNQDKILLESQREVYALKKKLITVGTIVLTLLALYIFIVFRQNAIKKSRNRIEIKKQLDLARINPEFISKEIKRIQLDKIDSQNVKERLELFGKLVNKVLESSYNDFMTIDKEIEFLSEYMDLQQAGMKRKFTYSFDVDPSINQQDVCIPTMILQPFIESSIDDSFKNLGRNGELLIRFNMTKPDELSIKIQDNGHGLKAIDSARSSEIINDRLMLLNASNRGHASFLIRERSTGGVSVEIYLPLITKSYADELKNSDI
jgi:hypothetical protein